jgi:hypothetical protein
MPEAAHKPVGAVDKPAEVPDKPVEADTPAAVDRRVEEVPGTQEAVGKPEVGAGRQAVEAETAGEVRLPLRQACHRPRKNGHYPLDCGHNRYKNVETFFTSLAGFIRVPLLWHTKRAGSMGFAQHRDNLILINPNI